MNGKLFLSFGVSCYEDYKMNALLLKLLGLKNKLNHNGWITIVPHENKDLVIRAEWYLGQKYGYEQHFTVSELESLNIDLADYFIDMANLEIEHMLGKSI